MGCLTSIMVDLTQFINVLLLAFFFSSTDLLKSSKRFKEITYSVTTGLQEYSFILKYIF